MAFTVVGTKVYYANAMNGSYRSGTLNGDGSITWDSGEIVTGFSFARPSIAIDSNGKAFIVGGGTNAHFVVVSNVTGSWTSTTLSRVSAVFNLPQVTALTSGQMAIVVSDYTGDNPDIFIFNGFSWTKKTSLSANTYGMLYSDIVGTNYVGHDQVQGAFWNNTLQTIDYVSYDVQNDSWSTPFNITNHISYPSAISAYENTLVIGYSDNIVNMIAARASYFQGIVWQPEFTISPAPESPHNLIGFYFTTLPQKFNAIFDVATGGVYFIDDPLPSNITIIDLAHATDSVGPIGVFVVVMDFAHATDFVFTNFFSLIDFATATDSIIISGNKVYVSMTDKAYAQDFISVARFTND